MKSYEFLFIAFWLCIICAGCSLFQSGETTNSQPVTQEQAHAACTASCAAFDWTSCDTEVKKSLPIGEILETVGGCYERCQEFIEDSYRDVDAACLSECRDCPAVWECLDKP